MFKPNKNVTHCPICGAPLDIATLTQFDLPIGYQAQCRHCHSYSDIWVNGLQEVGVGHWESDSFSDPCYGAPSVGEKAAAFCITLEANCRILALRLSQWLKARERSVTTYFTANSH